MEVLQETPLRLSRQDHPETPLEQTVVVVQSALPFKNLSSQNSSRTKRPPPSSAPSKLTTNKKKRLDEDAVQSRDIDARIRIIFPDDHAISKPCMSARLFACFTILSEAQSQSMAKQDTPRMTRRGQAHQLSILKMLQMLVKVECSSLGAGQVENRKVQFSAFDGSSTKPPRDSVLGSHGPRHDYINAMVEALSVIQDMLEQKEEHHSMVSSLQQLAVFLETVESTGEYGSTLRIACTKSMPFYWVPTRFIRAARVYRDDVLKLRQCLEQKNHSLAESNVQLHLEQNLAESLGRAVRYHLRRFFNPIYGRVVQDQEAGMSTTMSMSMSNTNTHTTNTSKHLTSNDLAALKRQSKICTILQMQLPVWYTAVVADSAVADGSVSTIFGMALEMMESHFGAHVFLSADDEFFVPSIPGSFCDSEPCRRGVGHQAATEHELETILEDTCAAISFLAGAKGCRFLMELKNWPGVQDEIERLGGWGIVEQCAQQFDLFHLERVSPNDAHFRLLMNVSTLFSRAEQCWKAMESAAETCTAALDQLWDRFECDSRISSRRREKYPEIDAVHQILMNGLKRHMFPHIIAPLSVSTNHGGGDGDNDEKSDEIPSAVGDNNTSQNKIS